MLKIDPKDCGAKNLKRQGAEIWYLLRALKGHWSRKYSIGGRAPVGPGCLALNCCTKGDSAAYSCVALDKFFSLSVSN